MQMIKTFHLFLIDNWFFGQIK